MEWRPFEAGVEVRQGLELDESVVMPVENVTVDLADEADHGLVDVRKECSKALTLQRISCSSTSTSSIRSSGHTRQRREEEKRQTS
jgi:hypothetical protein